MKYTKLSLQELRDICINDAEKIKKEFDVDLIIYVAKAGLPIAIYMNEVFSADLLGISAQRKGNSLKSKLGPYVAYFPRFIRDMLITIELKTKVHKKDTDRSIKFHESYEKLHINNYNNILIVDDSVDTGNSMKLVYEEVKRRFVGAMIRTYSLNIWDESTSVFTTNYYSFKNTVIQAPMSKDSKEYKKFCEMYSKETNNGYL